VPRFEPRRDAWGWRKPGSAGISSKKVEHQISSRHLAPFLNTLISLRSRQDINVATID